MATVKSFLHELPDFDQLIAVVSRQKGIDPVLIEKDYWLMHSLWGLQQQGFVFELKGGTSLSKGFGLIDRFSEDIDLRIEPPASLKVKTGVNHDKHAHIESRRQYYEWLRINLRIPSIESVERDTAFDDEKLRSAGLRLNYASRLPLLAGVKTGILLELGFDTTAPNRAVMISSWAWDAAMGAEPALQTSVFDNRAKDVPCYLPGYTLVEKLQTISTKYRRYVLSQTADVGNASNLNNQFPRNFLRHYYDVYSLLDSAEVQTFIGSPAYHEHKKTRFRQGDNLVISQNPAFTLKNQSLRAQFEMEYKKTAALYYAGQPPFEALMARLGAWLQQL